MRLKFLGAAGTVTGSSYLLTSDSGSQLLIDFGMYQGVDKINALNYLPLQFDPAKLSAVVLTHAHLDHCGRLPMLVNHGFTGQVWMTTPTQDLVEITLLDSAKIAKQDSKPFLYDKEDVEQLLLQIKTSNYEQSSNLGDFEVIFHDAGHILGSACVEIIDLKSTSEIKHIVFSGDLGNTPEPLEQPTAKIASADIIVMESTYGDRLHPKLDAGEAILNEILAVEKTGATLLIPAFSLERTQEILHIIKHLKLEGKVKNETEVFLDGPMALKATKVYQNYANWLNKHIEDELNADGAFEFPGLHQIMTPEESEAIYLNNSAKVIVAGSGMMTGGRIMRHALHYLPMSSTRLLMVGYQGEETLGRKILDGEKQVTIEDQAVNVMATVSFTEAMSSHADQGQLLEWLKNIKSVKQVFLTHGEDGSRQSLAAKIKSELGLETIVPKLNEEVVLI